MSGTSSEHERAGDAELLRVYARVRDEAAFAELVRRHLNGVYSAALRRVGGDAHLAQDVAQKVFVALARKADAVSRHPLATSWLYRVTRHEAANAVRGERRRKARESEAMIMQNDPAENSPAADWRRVAPVLDEVVDALSEPDRTAILLRFVDHRPFAEIGATLRVSEDAARMRVDRALDKLRLLLGRRGVTSTAAALGVVLTDHAVVAAPAGLAAGVTSHILIAGASGATGTIAFMSLTKMGIGLTVVAAGAAGFWWQHEANAKLRENVSSLEAQVRNLNTLRTANGRLQALHAAGLAQEDVLRGELADLKARPASVLPPPAPSASAKPESGKSFSLATDLRPAATLTNAGRENAKAAAETFIWAVNGGDVATMTTVIAIPSEAREQLAAAFARLPPDRQAEYGSPERMLATLLSATTQVAGVQIMQDRRGARGEGADPALANDDGYRTLHVQKQYVDGRVREQDMIFQQSPDGWRWLVPAGVAGKLGMEAGAPRPANAKGGG
jgi:RNA polymerase sigma factor (sigma-70 family)